MALTRSIGSLYVDFSPESPIAHTLRSKTCVSCKHFEARHAACAKFGSFHLVTGEVEYRPVNVVRTTAGMCGIDGKYHEPRKTRKGHIDPVDDACYSPDGFHWLNCCPM
jgi:hypothetical protein